MMRPKIITMLRVTIKRNSSLHLVISVLPSSTSHALEFKSCPLEYLSVSTYCMQTWREFEFALKRQLLPFCRCLPGQRECGLLQSLITLHNIDNINDVTVHSLYRLFESLLCYLALFNSHGRSAFRFA